MIASKYCWNVSSSYEEHEGGWAAMLWPHRTLCVPTSLFAFYLSINCSAYLSEAVKKQFSRGKSWFLGRAHHTIAVVMLKLPPGLACELSADRISALAFAPSEAVFALAHL